MGEIVACKVHPGIGVARVGKSPDAFFIGPEAPGRPADPGDGFKDERGRVKRQAARFRIYGYDAAGRVVRELTTAEAEITWTVHLVNAKGSSKEFVGRHHQTTKLRNPSVPGPSFPSRDALVIEPGPRSVAGPNRAGADLQFDGGRFLGMKVPLGELRTDEAGRLLVLGGFGNSDSVTPNNPIGHYANNNGWFDDTSDGPVTARVVLKAGGSVPVTGSAWVLVAPPDFSPHTENLVTLYDVAAAALLPAPELVSFTTHIYPLLARAANLAWLNRRARERHAPGRRGGFLDPDRISRLADNSQAAREGQGGRQAVFDRIRAPGARLDQANDFFMPILSGDDGDAEENHPKTWLAMLPSQYRNLERWAEGDFIADWSGPPSPPELDAIPVEEQPGALDRAALEACVGGPFFPGIEMSFIAGEKALYAEPIRLRAGLEPGDITKQMALPWQADFYDCQVHWWPAQRPDDVLTEARFDELARTIDAGDGPGTLAARLAGVSPDPWAREVTDKQDMVAKWHRLGFVAPRSAPNQEVALVETERDPSLERGGS